MIATTPSGTRTRWTRSPFGRVQPSATSPTGSGSAATARSPLAMARSRMSERRSRSTTVAAWPSASAAATSSALADEDLGVAVEEQVGGGQEGGVLHLGGGRGQHPAGRLGAGAELGDGVEGHPGSVGARPRPSHRDPGPGGRLSPWARHQQYGRPPPRPRRDGRGADRSPFHDDPVMQWLFGAEPPRPMRYTRPFFTIEGRRHLQHRDRLHGRRPPRGGLLGPAGALEVVVHEHAAPGAGHAPRHRPDGR